MSRDDLRLDAPLRDEVAAFFEARAADVDTGRLDVRPGLAFVHERVLTDPPADDGRDLPRVAATIATVAWSDLATAFSLWCHRMVIEYLSLAPAASSARRELFPSLLRLERLGSTGLAAAMAHVTSGAPLPIAARRDGAGLSRDGDAGLVLDGKVRWASNLFTPDFVLVTASAGPAGDPPLVVALPGDTPRLRVEPYPALVALQATASSSITLSGVRVRHDRVLGWDLAPFARRVRPTFLILQSAFCWGLARRASDEAARVIAPGSVLAPDLSSLEGRAATLASSLRAAAALAASHRRAAGATGPTDARDLVALRLEAARLATEAVALELKALGSRAYLRSSSTARRLREAAFLPIQAPTEAQLRAELAATDHREQHDFAAV